MLNLPIKSENSKNPWCNVKKTMHKGLENINRPLRGFVRRFYVSNVEEFLFRRKRQYSHNERNTLKLWENCERSFDGAFSSSFEITFFWVCLNVVWQLSKTPVFKRCLSMASNETVLVENARSRMYLILCLLRNCKWYNFETAFSTSIQLHLKPSLCACRISSVRQSLSGFVSTSSSSSAI